MKVFSKIKWLEKANEQIAQGFLSKRERDDAIKIWVNDLEGKTYEEITANGNEMPDDYFLISKTV